MQIGTLSIAIIAKAMNVKVYVMAETFKFNQIYPLDQKGIPEQFKVSYSTEAWSLNVCSRTAWLKYHSQ